VLQLRLEEADHLDGRPGGPRDGNGRAAVRLVDLLNSTVGHLVSLGGLAVSGHHHAVPVLERQDRGSVRDADGRPLRFAVRPNLGQKVRGLRPEEIHEARRHVVGKGAVPGFLHVGLRKYSALLYPEGGAGEVLEEILGGGRLIQEMSNVGLRPPEGLEHEDLLERAFLEVEDD